MSNHNRFATMLQNAVQEGRAVAAFNVYNLESATAAVQAAQRTGAPVILALGERYFANVRPVVMRAMVDALVPADMRERVALHLDHAAAKESCMEAIEAGFDSVMIDGSHLPFAQNAQVTKEVVEAAHARGVGVEAELGGLAAGDSSHEFSTGTQVLTDPEQAALFVAETNVDALAVSVGTVHGLYRGEPHVDLPRLQEIHQRIAQPLVLHGGSGTPAPLLREAVARGVAKVNVNTEVALAAVQRIAGLVVDKPRIHFAELGLASVEAMTAVMEDYILRFDSKRPLPLSR
ncbi:class II fructose-bisphosphate aldolase [Alicyclobacillus tolerans]|uniref:class II fructose-bisphosphate aldolase n=1 Tax=Alicyclobacillus tolerans TaxID=90970 RepID=UPI001F37BBC2|nr:class II fructose-bisphosphate aldolase [Alicyclobacillus tolerans]MCF8565818.1 class II fructose-bisphosphate aldolase [Alicyclobacillus tolerans]